MTFSGCLSTLETHLAAAGGACTPAITDIGCGDPGLPNGRVLRYWYTGSGAPSRMGARSTLTDEMIGEQLVIRAYFPIPTRSDKAVMRALEVDCQAIARQLTSRLNGDRTLGGNCVDLTVGDVNVGYLNGDATFRTVEIPLTLDFVDIDTIAA